MLQKNSPLKFAIIFIVLFIGFYYFNIYYFAATNPGRHYNAFLADYLNYIKALRWLLLSCTSLMLKLFGFNSVYNDYNLLVAGHGKIQVVYTCLGLGVLSFYTAFIIAYPKPLRSKIISFAIGVISIEFLNIIRFMLLALYGSNQDLDHHTIFNIIIYVFISAGLYFWIKQDIITNTPNEAD